MTFDIRRLQAIVREAGKILKEARVDSEGVDKKQGDANFVTVYDVQIQQFLMKKLSQMIPDAALDASEDVKRTVTEAQETAAASHKSDLEAFAEGNEILKQITDLALLANGMLKGKELSEFIARSTKVVEDAYLK